MLLLDFFARPHLWDFTGLFFSLVLFFIMSSTFHHLWRLNQNYSHRYYPAPPNYYVSRNIVEDPYLRDFYATTMNYNTGNYHYYQIDDHHVYGAAHDQFPSMASTNSQSRNTHNGESSFGYTDDPYMWEDDFHQPMGEFVDNVYVINERGFIDHHQANSHYVSRNIGDRYFAPHNSAFTIPDHTYNGQSSFDHTDDPYLWYNAYNQPIGEFINHVNDDANDQEAFLALIRLLVHLVTSVEGNEEEEAREEVVANLMKTRTRCNTDDGEEICVICQCEYENDETIGTLQCQHEYHASCIKEWLMKGKRSCPICRSSVLPS